MTEIPQTALCLIANLPLYFALLISFSNRYSAQHSMGQRREGGLIISLGDSTDCDSIKDKCNNHHHGQWDERRALTQLTRSRGERNVGAWEAGFSLFIVHFLFFHVMGREGSVRKRTYMHDARKIMAINELLS